MADRFDKYNSILKLLADEAGKCAPSAWNKATLTIKSDVNAIVYKLKSDDDQSKARVSEKLSLLCQELYSDMSKNGDAWNESLIQLNKADGAWAFKAYFRYPESREKAVPAAPQEQASTSSQPWWKALFGSKQAA